MKRHEFTRHQAFGRIQTFGLNHASDFAPGSEAMKHFANVGGILTDLCGAKTRQPGGDTTARDALYDTLRLDLQNIARTAAAIAQDEPGFGIPYRLPDSTGQAALLTAADATILRLHPQPGDDAATKSAKTALVARFVALELRAGFVQDLIDARAAIDAAQDDVESDDNEGVESTATIGRLVRAGMKELNYLDAIMHNKYARDPDKLRAWESASHIERPPQREKDPDPKAQGKETPAPAEVPATPNASTSAPAPAPTIAPNPAQPAQPKVA